MHEQRFAVLCHWIQFLNIDAKRSCYAHGNGWMQSTEYYRPSSLYTDHHSSLLPASVHSLNNCPSHDEMPTMLRGWIRRIARRNCQNTILGVCAPCGACACCAYVSFYIIPA